MSRRARKVFRATVVEGFGGLIFLMLVGAALPRLVDSGNISGQEEAAQVQNIQPDANRQSLQFPANDPPQTTPQTSQESSATDSSITGQAEGLRGLVGWERIHPKTRVYLTDLRAAIE